MKYFGVIFAFVIALFAMVVRGEILTPTEDTSGVLEGVVTFSLASEPYFFIVDEAGAPWRIETLEPNASRGVVAGDRVRAEGVFPKWRTTPRLNKATIAKLGTGAPIPLYLEMTPDEMYALDSDGEPGRRAWYGRLVSVNGIVLDINRRETYTQLLLGPKRTGVQVSIPCKRFDSLPDDLEIGSRVRVRGVGVYVASRDAKTNMV